MPGLTVAFHARYLGSTPLAGFTTPQWFGYTALPAYTASFDTGRGRTIDPVTVWPGDTLQLPAAPVRQGHTFTGWYTTPQSETPFDPALPLRADVTVHAGWEFTLALSSLGMDLLAPGALPLASSGS